MQHHTVSGRSFTHFTFSPRLVGLHCTSNPSVASPPACLFSESLPIDLVSLLPRFLSLLFFNCPVALPVDCPREAVQQMRDACHGPVQWLQSKRKKNCDLTFSSGGRLGSFGAACTKHSVVCTFCHALEHFQNYQRPFVVIHLNRHISST